MLAARLLTVGLFVWFALLFSLVLVRMLNGDIRARGFLRTQGSPNPSTQSALWRWQHFHLLSFLT